MGFDNKLNVAMSKKWDSFSTTKKIIITAASGFGVYFLIMILIAACIWSGIIPHAETKPKASDPKPRVVLPKYKTIEAVLDSAGDYRKEQGTLKIVSKDEVHVSSIFLDNEKVNLMTSLSKRDVVYVALQVFAQTDIDWFKVRSIPMVYKASEGVDPKKIGDYWGMYEVGGPVTRTGGEFILKKYLGLSKFERLYQMDEFGLKLNSNFERLISITTINEVYDDLMVPEWVKK